MGRQKTSASDPSWPPDYTDVFLERMRRYEAMKADPVMALGAVEYYSTRPKEFISDWCDTYDPRNAFGDLPSRLPLVLFPRQMELVDFLIDCLEDQQNGLVDKSRDMGATWVGISFSLWLWRYRPGASVGWGSRKADLVDRIGDADSIFEKIRTSLMGWPRFFWPKGFDPTVHAKYMSLFNPETGASITGEAGDNIGRGGRKLIYFKDESAHYEHPESIEAALMDNTRVQIDISTPHGIGTVYDRKKESGHVWRPDAPKPPRGTTRVFVLDWRDHPAKDEKWYKEREKAAKDAGLLHLFRQEVDRDAAASLVGLIIRPEWIKASIDAHIKLGIPEDGGWSAALDVADEGEDLHALTARKGIVLRHAEDWGDGDVGEATRRAVGFLRPYCPLSLQYDCIGVGAGVKSEANRLMKEESIPRNLSFVPWNAGAGVLKPDDHVVKGDRNTPLNKDFYSNLKAQGWWELARRFERTYRMITEDGVKFPFDQLISIDSRIPCLRQLERELAQPTITYDGKLRLVVDKKPEGARSPNLADSVVMNYFPLKAGLVVPESVVKRAARRG